MERVRAITFDLDDTLCGYWRAVEIGLRKTFASHPAPGLEPDDLWAAWCRVFPSFCGSIKTSPWYSEYLERGEPTRTELMRLLLADLGIHDRALALRLSATYARERDLALELFPEAREVLESLHGKFSLGLLTNGPADVQRSEIATLGIEKYFDHICIEGELGLGKPEPQVFARLEELFGLEPAELLMVGNSYRHDVAPALERGWRTAWVRRPSDVAPSSTTGAPEERPPGSRAPDLVVGNLAELAQHLPS